MKKVILLLLTFCLFGMCGCHSPDEQPVSSPAVEAAEQAPEREWTGQDLASMFHDIKEESWSMADCVLFSDRAYDCVGAVLFSSENGAAHVAFLDQEGGHQLCGFGDSAATDPDLRYLGNGAVAFKLQTGEGTVYDLKLSFSRDGSNINLKAESDLK